MNLSPSMVYAWVIGVLDGKRFFSSERCMRFQRTLLPECPIFGPSTPCIQGKDNRQRHFFFMRSRICFFTSAGRCTSAALCSLAFDLPWVTGMLFSFRFLRRAWCISANQRERRSARFWAFRSMHSSSSSHHNSQELCSSADD